MSDDSDCLDFCHTWLPDFLEHGHIQAQLVDDQVVGVVFQAFKTEPLVAPVLSKVAVHRIVLQLCSIFAQNNLLESFTIFISEIGPMDLIKMFTFTWVVFPD